MKCVLTVAHLACFCAYDCKRENGNVVEVCKSNKCAGGWNDDVEVEVEEEEELDILLEKLQKKKKPVAK